MPPKPTAHSVFGSCGMPLLPANATYSRLPYGRTKRWVPDTLCTCAKVAGQCCCGRDAHAGHDMLYEAGPARHDAMAPELHADKPPHPCIVFWRGLHAHRPRPLSFFNCQTDGSTSSSSFSFCQCSSTTKATATSATSSCKCRWLHERGRRVGGRSCTPPQVFAGGSHGMLVARAARLPGGK